MVGGGGERGRGEEEVREMKGDVEKDEGGRVMDIFFFQAEDGIRDYDVTGVQTCALPI